MKFSHDHSSRVPVSQVRSTNDLKMSTVSTESKTAKKVCSPSQTEETERPLPPSNGEESPDTTLVKGGSRKGCGPRGSRKPHDLLNKRVAASTGSRNDTSSTQDEGLNNTDLA